MDAYVYQAELLCTECAQIVMDKLDRYLDGVPETEFDSDEYPKGPYPHGGGEADTPQHCGTCHVFLENPLTKDGEEYVRQALADGSGDSDTLWEWAHYYDWLVE